MSDNPLAALAMRERAAKTCDVIAGNVADFPRDHRRAAGQCAALIRALPTDFSDAELLTAAILGPRVRALVGAANALADEVVSYGNVNNLGDGERLHCVKQVRAALAPFMKVDK